METKAYLADMARGVPLWDQAHQALAEQVGRLLDGPDGQVAAGATALVAALEQDFRLEESLMETIDFPAICSHREQHARVLAALHGLAPDDIAATRHAVGLLLPWFELHLATADAALAIALQMAERADDASLAGRPATRTEAAGGAPGVGGFPRRIGASPPR